ncbi:MAG: YezD family protein [Verrucomicrobia bacterium]|nr:YezD family protein [Verrucomicrobiota bacterium]
MSASAQSHASATVAGGVSSAATPDWISLVREKVEGLRFGVVQLTVHDGRVTQIERTEKTRLPASRDGLSGSHE